MNQFQSVVWRPCWVYVNWTVLATDTREPKNMNPITIYLCRAEGLNVYIQYLMLLIICFNLFTLPIDYTTISCDLIVFEREYTWHARRRSTKTSWLYDWGYQNNYYYLTVVQLSVLGGLKYCHPCCGTDKSPSLFNTSDESLLGRQVNWEGPEFTFKNNNLPWGKIIFSISIITH